MLISSKAHQWNYRDHSTTEWNWSFDLVAILQILPCHICGPLHNWINVVMTLHPMMWITQWSRTGEWVIFLHIHTQFMERKLTSWWGPHPNFNDQQILLLIQGQQHTTCQQIFMNKHIDKLASRLHLCISLNGTQGSSPIIYSDYQSGKIRWYNSFAGIMEESMI